MGKYIKSADIRPNDIIKFEFEFGAYNNWVTARIDEVHIDQNSNPEETYYPQKLIWHYLSEESKEAPKDCRAEKLGNNPAWEQHTCYSNPNDIVEKLN